MNHVTSGWWFQTFFIFHNIWDVILPIDELIFFNMVKHVKTTSQIMLPDHTGNEYQWEFQDPKMEVPPINRFLTWPLIIVNHYQHLSTVINHYEPLLTVVIPLPIGSHHSSSR